MGFPDDPCWAGMRVGTASMGQEGRLEVDAEEAIRSAEDWWSLAL